MATSPLRSANRFDGWVPPSLASPWQTFWKSTTEASQSLWQRRLCRGRQYMVTCSAPHPPHGTRPGRGAARLFTHQSFQHAMHPPLRTFRALLLRGALRTRL